jgi:prepilin-type N-terminal cleavage/methylation domain-containing protein
MTAYIKRGFTLIELLIVMAILGVLAVVVLVAINPAEQLARTRDTGRVSAVTQIGHAVQAYYTAHNAVYPAVTTLTTTLVNSGEMGSFPAGIAYSSSTVVPTPAACGTNPEGSGTAMWCYNTNATDTIVFARLESKTYDSKCATGTDGAYILFSTTQGRGGVVCGAADPAPAASYTFVN